MNLEKMIKLSHQYADVDWGYYDEHKDKIQSTDNINPDFLWTLYNGEYFIQNREAYAYAAAAMNAFPKLLKAVKAAKEFLPRTQIIETSEWKILRDALEELEK